MKKPVCFLMPAYNASRYIALAIESVQAQTYPEWRLVIVNDGSKDDTEAIARGYAAADPRIQVYSQLNRGISATRNVCLSHVPDDAVYLFNLDADDVLEVTALEELVQYLESHPNAGAVFCGATLINGQGDRLGERATHRFKLRLGVPTPLRGNGPVPFFNLYCAYGIGPFALIRRDAVPKTIEYSTNYHSCEDVDMFVRMGLKFEIHQYSRALYLYRWHGNNTSTYNAKNQEDQVRFYEAWDAVEGSNPAERSLLAGAREFRAQWHPAILKGKLLAAYTRDTLRSKGTFHALLFSRRIIPWAFSVLVRCCRHWVLRPRHA